MITTYVEEIGHWESWQGEYRFGTFLILPPDPLLLRMNALRAKHDPRSQSICDAHISLTVPLPRSMAEKDWGELESIAAGFPHIAIRYGPLANYRPHPGVVLAIEPQEKLDKLRAALEATSVFPRAPTRTHPFSAHMTVAEFISIEETEALMMELADVAHQGTFLCTGVSYAVPDGDFHFTERRRRS